jgi:hypothetical protein
MSPEFLDGLRNFGVDADALSVIEPHSFKVDSQPYVRLKSSPSGALRLIGIAHARKLADYARRMGERTLADRIEAAIPKPVQGIRHLN